MIVYMALLSYWGLAGFVLNIINNRVKVRHNHYIYFIIAGTSLFFIMALRDVTVGTDTFSYYYEYQNADVYINNLFRPTELGYSYFNYVINRLGLGFQTFLAIIATFIVFSISILYYKYSKNILLSYYLFVTIGLFSMSMTGLRQTMAVSLTILAFIYLMKNKNALFFIFVGIAYFFHNSAIVFLLIFFLKKIRINKKIGAIIYIVSGMLFFMKGWLSLLIEYITPEKYLRYMSADTHINSLVIIIAMLIPLVCLLFWPKGSLDNEEHNKTMSLIFLISCLNFVMYFLALEINMFQRLSLYLIIYNGILIPNVIEGIKSKEIRMIAKIACIFFPLVQFIMSTPGGSFGIDEYKFFWG